MVNAKERRIQKSREHNPLCSKYKGKRKDEDKVEELPNKRAKREKLDDSSVKPYAGVSGKLGQDKLRSNFHLRSQAALHARSVKKERRLRKATKQTEVTKKERAKKKQERMPVRRLFIIYFTLFSLSLSLSLTFCLNFTIFFVFYFS